MAATPGSTSTAGAIGVGNGLRPPHCIVLTPGDFHANLDILAVSHLGGEGSICHAKRLSPDRDVKRYGGNIGAISRPFPCIYLFLFFIEIFIEFSHGGLRILNYKKCFIVLPIHP